MSDNKNEILDELKEIKKLLSLKQSKKDYSGYDGIFPHPSSEIESVNSIDFKSIFYNSKIRDRIFFNLFNLFTNPGKYSVSRISDFIKI